MVRLFACVALVLSLAGCGSLVSPNAPHRQLSAALESATVAMVDVGDGAPRVYCAGVWVSPDKFLTAAHCIRHIAQLQSPTWLSRPEDVEDDVAGHDIAYRTNDDTYFSSRESLVVKYQRSVDLGLVQALPPVPAHAIARVSLQAIEDGDRIEVVGHPGGTYEWSYTEGLVSATRPNLVNFDDQSMLTLQLQVPVSPGNSGGGAFDWRGDLIGICSFLDSSASGIGYFVHRDVIVTFLKQAGVLH